MPERDPIFQWLEVLDELTYYELFGIAQQATADEVRDAFHAFCETFHPDLHVGRDPEEQQALSAIFQRGTEAYQALGDHELRARYDEQLAATRPARSNPPRLSFSPHLPTRTSAPPGEAPYEQIVRSPAARPFARRAWELAQKGDLRQAKLQLVMANHMDAGNEELDAALKELEQRLSKPPPR
jgi:curved DNA-binding protein CbpA